MVKKSIAPLLLSLAGGPPDSPSPGGQAVNGNESNGLQLLSLRPSTVYRRAIAFNLRQRQTTKVSRGIALTRRLVERKTRQMHVSAETFVVFTSKCDSPAVYRLPQLYRILPMV